VSEGNGNAAIDMHSRRDILDDDEDVSDRSDRDLVLRAVNSSLRTEHGMGQLAGEIAKLTAKVTEFGAGQSTLIARVGSLARHVRTLTKRFDGEEIEMRAKQASRPAIDELEERLEETSTGPHVAMTQQDVELLLLRKDRESAIKEVALLRAAADAKTAKDAADEAAERAREERAIERAADRKWKILAPVITGICMALLAVLWRVMEASIRGHW
jgi:hypothetical protein